MRSSSRCRWSPTAATRLVVRARTTTPRCRRPPDRRRSPVAGCSRRSSTSNSTARIDFSVSRAPCSLPLQPLEHVHRRDVLIHVLARLRELEFPVLLEKLCGVGDEVDERLRALVLGLGRVLHVALVVGLLAGV